MTTKIASCSKVPAGNFFGTWALVLQSNQFRFTYNNCRLPFEGFYGMVVRLFPYLFAICDHLKIPGELLNENLALDTVQGSRKLTQGGLSGSSWFLRSSTLFPYDTSSPLKYAN